MLAQRARPCRGVFEPRAIVAAEGAVATAPRLRLFGEIE